jgi:Protein of unknown function (DUF1573)
MKRILFVISFAALASCNSAGNNNNSTTDKGRLPASLVNNPLTANGVDTVAAERKPVLSFKDTLHEFGSIHEGEVVSYDFNFTNTGKTPLIISSAQGSCGCTVPQFPHDAIAPGQSSVLKVTFNSAGKQGTQHKSVTLHTNTVRNIEMLYITADVQKK